MKVDPSNYPKLSREQAGHIRHFHNLASQADGEWHHMGTQEPMQEFLDAYRYQLATMAYAVAVTHYHHQDALRGSYKPLFRRLIHKMLRREVWGYWFNTSLGGVTTDPSLTELRKPWADPIVRENIMYSGHLFLMISLYAMLFDDDEFEQDDSIVFRWNPLFFGLGPETFTYKTQTLQEAIMREMERNGWVGVCCEPNAAFVVCNQFPIIAMRLNDVRHGTNVVADVLEKYQAAWEKKGMVGANGLFKDMWLVKQDATLPAMDPAFTAWACAFMNSWNSDFVRACYDQQALGFITTIDGETRLQPTIVGNAYRKIAAEENKEAGKTPKETLEEALDRTKKILEDATSPSPDKPLTLFTKPTFGYVSQWLSELGKPELPGLLKFADDKLKPTWEKGGLYYPRNDVPTNKETLEWTHMDPFSGNAAIGYARLNVADGMKRLWERPWTRTDVQARPWVDDVTLADGIDFLRGFWDAEKRALMLTVRSWDGCKRKINPVFKNLNAGKWVVYVDGQLERKENVVQGEQVAVEITVGGEEMDVVVIKDRE